METPTGAVRLYLAALEPPGNVAAEVARLRARLFRALGEPSSRAFPELVPLRFARRVAPGAPALPKPREARGLVARVWSGARGGFSATEPFVVDGLAYLGVGGPFGLLADALDALLAELGLEGAAGPLAAQVGFFLCRAGDPEAVLRAAQAAGRGAIAFSEARLVLYRLDMGPDPLAALRWRELASAWRPKPLR